MKLTKKFRNLLLLKSIKIPTVYLIFNLIKLPLMPIALFNLTFLENLGIYPYRDVKETLDSTMQLCKTCSVYAKYLLFLLLLIIYLIIYLIFLPFSPLFLS